MQNPASPSSSRSDYDLIAQLLTDALTALEVDGAMAKRHILQARTLVIEAVEAAPGAQGGLAGWQMRRVSNFIHFNLATKLRIEQVARNLKVSPGYLSRAFKTSAGMTYSEFVLRARVELAKRLLLTTDTPICEIALACGLTDQAHLTRTFKRSVGMPPAAWRRRFGGCADEELFASGGDVEDQYPVTPTFDAPAATHVAKDRRIHPGDVCVFRGDHPDDDAASICDRLEVVMAHPEDTTPGRRLVLATRLKELSNRSNRSREDAVETRSKAAGSSRSASTASPLPSLTAA